MKFFSLARLPVSLALVLTLSALLGCPPAGNDDAGMATDAGPTDAGPPPIEYPPYEVDDGWYGDDPLPLDPAVCGASPYRWWGTEALGTIIQSQLKHEMSQELLLGLRNQLAQQIGMRREPLSGAKVHRILYQTQDRGSLEDATGLVAYPDVGQPSEWPVLLFLHGTVGFTDDCSPSSGIDNILAPNYANVGLVGLLASAGFIVVAPDYLGLKSLGSGFGRFHPYFVAEATAIASLDAVRAAKNLLLAEDPGVTPGPLVVMGVSQGGHAAAFTVRYQPHYASELPITGAAYVVPPLNLVAESLAALADPSPTTQGNAAVVLVSHDSWYESAPGRLSEVLKPDIETDIVEYMLSSCFLPELIGDPEDLFTPELLSAEILPWTCYAAANSLPFTTVERLDDVPALVVLAEEDTRVSTPVERSTVEQLCSAGHRLQYLECSGADHTEGFFYSFDDQLDFLEARLAGTPLPDNACAITPAQVCSSDPR